MLACWLTCVRAARGQVGYREAVDKGDGRTRHGGGGTHDLRGTASFRKRIAAAAAAPAGAGKGAAANGRAT